MNTGGVSPVPWLPNQLLAAGTSKRGIENPDTGWFYPRATMEEKRAARASEVWWRAGELNRPPSRARL